MFINLGAREKHAVSPAPVKSDINTSWWLGEALWWSVSAVDMILYRSSLSGKFPRCEHKGEVGMLSTHFSLARQGKIQ